MHPERPLPPATKEGIISGPSRLLREAPFVVALLILIAFAVSAASSATAVSCTKVASPNGNDSNSGSPSSPFKTAQMLLSSLGAGQVGCLTSGATFVQDVAKVIGSGTSSAPITITSTGSSPATLRGRLYIPTGANYVTVTNLILDGRNNSRLPSPAVNGDHAVFRYDEITNYHTGICFQLGNPGWGTPRGTLIDSNRIHDCGTLPATNHEHGIYVETTSSNVITNNYIYKNADRGVQLYPNAQGTQVTYNVIDANGEGVIFSGDGSTASSNNYVAHNIISNSNVRYNVESWWPGPIGGGNVVELNCIWHGAAGDIQTPRGFVARNNTTADPSFVNASGADYRLNSGSACSGMGPQTSQVGTGVAATSTPSPSTPSTPSPTTTTAGTFSVSSSLPGSLSGSVSWTATVSGLSASLVQSVVFSIDGKALWTEHYSPFVFNGDGKQLDTKTLSNATHTFLVTVTSTSGQTATTSVQSTVANGSASSSGTSTTTAPTPTPTPTPAPAPTSTSTSTSTSAPFSVTSSLTDQQKVAGSLSWSATVNGIPTSSVKSVVFWIDGKALWTEHYSPFVFNGNGKQLDTKTLINGTHTLLIAATSTSGQTATTSVQVKVAN